MTAQLVARVAARARDPAHATTASRLVHSSSRIGPERPTPLPPPASAAQVIAAEALLGFRLPPVLAALYMGVANGGFGPGYGIVGLPGGFLETDNIAIHDGQGLDLIGLYHAFRGHGPLAPLEHDFDPNVTLTVDPEGAGWYDRLLVICNHGCWQLSCLDCSKPDPPVLSYEGYQCELRFNYPSVTDWIEAWLEGGREFRQQGRV